MIRGTWAAQSGLELKVLSSSPALGTGLHTGQGGSFEKKKKNEMIGYNLSGHSKQYGSYG